MKATKTIAVLLAVGMFLSLAGTAGASIVVTPDHIVSGSATGTLVAIDTPTGALPARPTGSDWPDDADDGWEMLNGSGNDNSAGTRFWEPDGSSDSSGNVGMKWFNNTVTWTFDLPDDAIINDVYASWGKTQGNTPGGTYSYSEGAASGSVYLNQKVLPAGDIQLQWTDSASGTHTGWFERLFSGPITVADGDGFKLTTVADSICWSDAVVLDVTIAGGEIPEPATMCALGLALAGLGGYVRKRRRA